jgi:glutamate racemase
VDAVVLGCTHYPLIVDDLRAVGPEGVRWLDPSAAIADRLKTVLGDKHQPHIRAKEKDRAFFTDPSTNLDELRAFFAQFGFEDLAILRAEETVS